MFNMLRLVSYVLILMVVVLAAVLGQPNGTTELDLRVRPLAYWLCPEWQRSDELTHSRNTEFLQLEEKNRALQRLLNNEATLFETAAVFSRLNREWDNQRFASYYPRCSPEELACRQVIRWVEHTEGDHRPLVLRLEEELRLYKEQ